MNSPRPRLQLVSRFVPDMREAEIIHPLDKERYGKTPEWRKTEADEPPPIPMDALEDRGTLSLADIRTAAAHNITASVNRERARSAYAPRGSRFRRSSNQAPRIINAKFPGRCAELDTEILEGDRILWKPGSRIVYSANSERFQQFERENA